MNLVERIESSSVRGLTRLACVLALVALAALSWSVISPDPLPVIFAMSGGHLIGIAAFSCYLLAILLDLERREGRLPRRSGTQSKRP
jgi:hypothetical protein